MKISDIAKKIEAIDPTLNPIDVSRICNLLAAAVEETSQLNDDETLMSLWEEVDLRLCAAADQHAGVTNELSELVVSDPINFSREQIWTLVRAIKVQSQVIRLYAGDGRQVSQEA